MIPSLPMPTGQDQGTPSLVIEVEDVAYNVDVEQYVTARGP